MGSFKSAWDLSNGGEGGNADGKQVRKWSFLNWMSFWLTMQIALIICTVYYWGAVNASVYFLSGIGGSLLLECINYIEVFISYHNFLINLILIN